jgi:hypothetical protein
MSRTFLEKCEGGGADNKQRGKITLITCAGCYRGFLGKWGILGKANIRRGAGCSGFVLFERKFCLIDRIYKLL